MAGSSSRDTRRVAVKTWRTKALELRVDGLTIRAIAARLKKSVGAVHAAIEAEIAAIPTSAVLKLREVEGDRLDALIKSFLPKARKGDPEAAHVVISSVRQRSKLFGLEAPTRSEHSGPGGAPIVFDLTGPTNEQLDTLTARLAAGDDAGGEEGATEGPSSGTGEAQGGDEGPA